LNAVLLNGAESNDSTLEIIQQTIINELSDKNWNIKPFILNKMDVKPCAGCFGCWVQTPGICIIDDEGKNTTKAIIQSNLVVYLTPVTFGGYSSHLKKVLDRSIGLLLPFFKKIDGEMHHQKRYDHYPKLMGIGILDQPDKKSEQIFKTLLGRNGINMHTPQSTAGIIYRNHNKSDIQNNIRALLSELEIK